MSRFYEMCVEIESFKKAREEQITEACMNEWEFCADDFSVTQGNGKSKPSLLVGSAEGSLYGGESEEEFTDRLAAAIWKANGSFCEVRVRATYIENIPYQDHVRAKSDYKKWRKRK